MGDGKRTFDWMGNLSLQTNRNLHRFLTIDTRAKEEEEEQEEVTRKEEEEVELSLGLSLGGRFGTDKEKLVRSSSIAGTFPIVNKSDQDDGDDPPRCRHRTLGRTASLPVETEEEWRKRKEVQTLRRMAAKRRRSEKQRGGGGLTPPALGFARWVPPRHQPVVANQFKVGGDSHQGGGGSSSGGSESAQGSSSCGEASPASDVAGSSSNTKGKENASNSERETPPKRHEKVEKRNKERGLNSIEDMPCVFTQGDGPNGRRIEGILYRYGKGEEVSIMCVCHGRFLSPAEFVEHAGIVDVVHPLKHIVVNPSSNSYL